MQQQEGPVIDTVETMDGVQYKVERQLFSRYSDFYKTMVEENEQDVYYMHTIKSKQFDFIFEFLQLHKKEAPQPLGQTYPGVQLNSVMESADAQLIQRIFQGNADEGKAIIDAAFFLRMDQLFKRLSAGLMSVLNREYTRKMVEQSRKSALLDEAEVSGEIHKKIELILFKDKQNEPKPQSDSD